MHGYRKGVALADLGRFTDAVEAFHRAIERDPQAAKTHYDRGTALANSGSSWKPWNRSIGSSS